MNFKLIHLKNPLYPNIAWLSQVWCCDREEYVRSEQQAQPEPQPASTAPATLPAPRHIVLRPQLGRLPNPDVVAVLAQGRTGEGRDERVRRPHGGQHQPAAAVAAAPSAAVVQAPLPHARGEQLGPGDDAGGRVRCSQQPHERWRRRRGELRGRVKLQLHGLQQPGKLCEQLKLQHAVQLRRL